MLFKSHLYLSLLFSMLFSLMLTGCKQEAAPAGAPPAMPPMPVTYIVAKATDVPMVVEAVAQTEGASEVEVRPRVGGILLKKMYQEGETVKAGQLLFTIDPAPFLTELNQAKAQLAQQQARITQANREAARLKPLLDSQAISQREYDNATSDASIVQASVSQAQVAIQAAQLNLGYTKVAAPTAGVAGRFVLSEGALVQAGASLLTTIIQTSPIWVRFSLSESQLKSLGGSVKANNVSDISLILPDGSEYGQKGQLNFMASQMNPSLGSQELRATFDNKDKNLMPGQFVRARITTGAFEGVFLVPQTAVATGEQGNYVFIVNAKNQAERRSVVVGDWEGSDWVILSGLNANDKVIVDNLIKLNMMPPGAPVKPSLLGVPAAS